jgi:hypothetical protein
MIGISSKVIGFVTKLAKMVWLYLWFWFKDLSVIRGGDFEWYPNGYAVHGTLSVGTHGFRPFRGTIPRQKPHRAVRKRPRECGGISLFPIEGSWFASTLLFSKR